MPRKLSKKQYFQKKFDTLKSINVTKEKIEEWQERRKISRKTKIEKTPKLKERALIARTLLLQMDGKTLKQKRENFSKTVNNRDFSEFLNKKVLGTGAGISGATRVEKITAGIEKLPPTHQEILNELIENNFNLKGEKLNAGMREIINALEVSNIIEIRKWGRNIAEIKIKDTERLNKTQKTNYIQWPELPSLYKKRK